MSVIVIHSSDTPEELVRKMIDSLIDYRRNIAWPQFSQHCREVGEPEPSPEVLAEWEAHFEALEKELRAYFARDMYVGKAWSEAIESGDPLALKYQAELYENMAKPESRDVREFDEMQEKWAREKGLRLPELPQHIWHVEQVGDLCSITRDDKLIDVPEIPRSDLQRHMGYHRIVGDTFEDLCKQLDASVVR